MITIQNLSSNGFPVTVYGIGNTNVDVVVPGHMSLNTPGFVCPDGNAIYGGMLYSGSLVAYDGASGQQWALLNERGQTGYAFDGGVLGLTLVGVVWVAKYVRRGFKLNPGFKDE